MTHDSRRYHRQRRPTFTRAYGVLGALGGAAEAAGSAALGGLETAGTTALTGLESVGTGLQSLFGGGAGGGEAGYLASLGQAVPEGVELAGPSATFTGPGFLGSVTQGFLHGPQAFANPSAATSMGTGVGQLLSALEQMQGSGGGHQMALGQPLQPHQFGRQIVGNVGQQVIPGVKVIPSAPAKPEQGPIMKMIGQLFAGL
jgi:hypothetical protein